MEDKEKVDNAIDDWCKSTNTELIIALQLCERVRNTEEYSEKVPIIKNGKKTERLKRVPNEKGKYFIQLIHTKVKDNTRGRGNSNLTTVSSIAQSGALKKEYLSVLIGWGLEETQLQALYNIQQNRWKKRWDGTAWKWEAQNPTNKEWIDWEVRSKTPTDVTSFAKDFSSANAYTELAKAWGLSSEKEVKDVIAIWEKKLGVELPVKPTYTAKEQADRRANKILGTELTDKDKNEALKLLGLSGISILNPSK